MTLPVATRLVVQALREEAESFRDPWNPDVQAGIRRALGSVADRLEQAGSSVHPRTPAPAATAPAVSPEGHDPASGNNADLLPPEVVHEDDERVWVIRLVGGPAIKSNVQDALRFVMEKQPVGPTRTSLARLFRALSEAEETSS